MAKQPRSPSAKGKGKRKSNESAVSKDSTRQKKKQKTKTNVEPSEPKQGQNTKPEHKEAAWSKSKKKRMRMLQAKLKKQEEAGAAKPTKSLPPQEDESPPEEKSAPKNKLQDAFKARLSGSRFRILNEELYTTTSQESYDRFSKNPELFEQYHEGFRYQVESWPVNPVDSIVGALSSSYKGQPCVVADFGCGDAQLAKDLLKVKGSNKNSLFTVHSFDLVSPNSLVTACDMANVPLPPKSVDVCVFCLSLMGTNLADFVREAHRVLKDDGRVKIAEVRSRIEYSHSHYKGHQEKSEDKGKKSEGKKSEGKKSTTKTGTLEEFTDVLQELGFKCVRTDRSNKMFLLLELKKSGKKPNRKLTFSAKPCIYKRR